MDRQSSKGRLKGDAMIYNNITRNIALLSVVFLLLISVQGKASNTEDYQHVKKFEKINKSLSHNVEKLNQLLMSLSISSITGTTESKYMLLEKIREMESQSKKDFETLSHLNPSYKLSDLHTSMVDLVTSFHFMVQIWEKILENTDLNAISSTSELEKIIITPYKQMQSIINYKMKEMLRELNSINY